MTSEKTTSIQDIVQFTGVTAGTVYKWIRTGKLKAIKQGNIYDIPFSENREFLLAQLKKKRDKLQLAWTPKEIEDYSEWHELLDEICWLIKICYSSKDDIKHKRFRLDQLFVNYLTFHKVTLKKVRQVFVSNPNPNFLRVTDDLKRGWYNELSYALPLRKSTLGLSFSDISLNKQDSSIRFAFPSWQITSAYYSVYFYLRAITLQKQDGFRIQEHNATILGFKNNLLQPLMRVLWKFPFDIIYTPKTRVYKRNLLIESLEHTRFNYSHHPRPPHRTASQIFERIYKSFSKKAKSKSQTKPTNYMLFDYLHDFRIWANYLDIDNLLNLWGSGYKTFIDQNLSTLLFFIGGMSEIGYISVFGDTKYFEQLQGLYNLFIANNPELESEFINTPIYQRHLIYKEIGFTKSIITLKTKIDLNMVVATSNLNSG
jgi:hypothetical protein